MEGPLLVFKKNIPPTFILWKLMLQLAPARDGMNLSPCLLGDDSGDSGVGVR